MISKLLGDDNHVNKNTTRDLAWVWRSKIPKNHIFSWRLFLNHFPTKYQLAKRGILESSNLSVNSMCLIDDEDVLHLFLHYQVSVGIWHNVVSLLGIAEVQYLEYILLHLDQLCASTKRKFQDKFFCFFRSVVCWVLWTCRNDILFKGDILTNWNTLGRIKFITRKWYQVKYHSPPPLK